MTALRTTCTRLRCDACGYELDDPDEVAGDNTIAWLRHLAEEDGWRLATADGDICDWCVEQGIPC